MTSLVTIRDRALEPHTFGHLRRAIFKLGHERLRASYQTTFWFDLAQKPTSLVERAAQRCLDHLPAERRRGVIGVEWWLSRMRTSNVKVDFHRDRDNALFYDTGKSVHPRTSSVLYVTSCVGGLLAVTRSGPNPRNQACAPTRHEFDLVEPRPNRFVFFSGTLTHGVLDARNCIPGARLPTEPGWRIGIALNFWHRRPQRVPAFVASSHYRTLSCAD